MPRVSIAFAVAACLFGAAPAGADNQGANGAIVGLQVNDSSSDQHAATHGRVWVETSGQLQEYLWGGAICSNFNLNDVEVAMLQRALDNPRILIRPFWKNGTGGTRCIVAFLLIRRDWEGLF